MTFTSGAILTSSRTEPCKDCTTNTSELELAKHRGRCTSCFNKYDDAFRAVARDAFDTHLAIMGTNSVLYAFRHDSADIDFDAETALDVYLHGNFDDALIDPTPEQARQGREVLTRWEVVYANPILDSYRGNLRHPEPDDTVDTSILGITKLWLWYLETGNQEVSWDPWHIEHATAVLTRIAAHEEAKL